MADIWDLKAPELGEAFAQKKGALSPEAIKAAQDQYQGIEGYRRMHQELTQSLYNEMPELQGVLELVDFSADPDEEIQRVAANLNLPLEQVVKRIGLKNEKGEITDIIPGRASIIETDDGRYVCIARGLGLDKNHPDLDFNAIEVAASVNIHEIFHCLDEHLKTKITNPSSDRVSSDARQRAVEQFADIGRYALRLNNGDTLEDLEKRITYNDLFMPFDWRKDFAYDNGLTLRTLHSQYQQPTTDLTSFYMKHWKATLQQADELRSQASNLNTDHVLRDLAQAVILETVVKHKAGEFLSSPQGSDAVWQAKGKTSAERVLIEAFASMDYKGIKEGSFEFDGLPEEDQAGYRAAFKLHDDLKIWIENHRQLVPAADRILDSQARLQNGHSLPFKPVTDKEQTGLQLIGEAALYLQREPDNPLAEDILKELTFWLFISDAELEEWANYLQVESDLENNPDFAKHLASGGSITDYYEGNIAPINRPVPPPQPLDLPSPK